MGERVRQRIGYYVEVELEAYEGEGHMVAEIVLGWPGDWRPPHDPVVVSKRFGQHNEMFDVSIIRSQVLMVKPIPGAVPTDQQEEG